MTFFETISAIMVVGLFMYFFARVLSIGINAAISSHIDITSKVGKKK